MERMNGMELAREIRKKDRNVAVAFLTNDPGFVFDGYEVEAVGYLMKPVDPGRQPALLLGFREWRAGLNCREMAQHWCLN